MLLHIFVLDHLEYHEITRDVHKAFPQMIISPNPDTTL